MRIVLVTTSWPCHEGDPSGHFVQAEGRELERAGHEVVVVTPEPGGAFGWPGVSSRVRERPWRAIDALRWVARARAQVAGMQADRVVAHWAVPCAWPVGIAARGAELEVVSHGGDVRLLVAMPRTLRRRVVRAIASRATVWSFVSEALRDRLLASLGGGRSERVAVEAVARIRAAHLHVPDVKDAIDERRRHLAGARVAVSVGRLVASKRVDRAIEHVAAADDLDALVVVGDGPERARLQQLARARGVDARFVGRVTRHEALAWIGAARVVLHGSEKEGLSTVLREAERLGVPVRQLMGD
jgi:teichuronic acid biosynthesis glycosyltransferase TuaC